MLTLRVMKALWDRVIANNTNHCHNLNCLSSAKEMSQMRSEVRVRIWHWFNVSSQCLRACMRVCDDEHCVTIVAAARGGHKLSLTSLLPRLYGLGKASPISPGRVSSLTHSRPLYNRISSSHSGNSLHRRSTSDLDHSPVYPAFSIEHGDQTSSCRAFARWHTLRTSVLALASFSPQRVAVVRDESSILLKQLKLKYLSF